MTVIMIVKDPDFKEIEQELGIPIECVAYKSDGIYIQTREELTDGQTDNAKKVLEKHFPNKKIEKTNRKIKPRTLGNPNVDKNHLYRDLPIKNKIKIRRDAIKHYERAIAYEENQLQRKPNKQEKIQKNIKKITHLKDKEAAELDALIAEKKRVEDEAAAQGQS